MEVNSKNTKVNEALFRIADKLDSLHVNWLLGASGGLMVHGVDVEPYDLDIFVSKEDVVKLVIELAEFIKNPVHVYKEKQKEYLEFQINLEGIEIEICELDMSKANPVRIVYKGKFIPVNPLIEELDFYKSRKGKEEIVFLIEDRLKNNPQ